MKDEERIRRQEEAIEEVRKMGLDEDLYARRKAYLLNSLYGKFGEPSLKAIPTHGLGHSEELGALEAGKSRWAPGTLVRLKSGGPTMVVGTIVPPDHGPNVAGCVWFDDDRQKVRTIGFPDVVLEEVHRPGSPHLEGRGLSQSLTDEEYTFLLKALNARRAEVARGETP